MQAGNAPLIDGMRDPGKISSISRAPSTPAVRFCDCKMKSLE